MGRFVGYPESTCRKVARRPVVTEIERVGRDHHRHAPVDALANGLPSALIVGLRPVGDPRAVAVGVDENGHVCVFSAVPLGVGFSTPDQVGI